MVSARPLMFKSSGSFTNILGIVPRAPTTIGITVTFMLLCILALQQRSGYNICSLLFSICGSLGRQSSLYGRFFFCWLSLSLVVWRRLNDMFVSRNHREMCASHSLRRIASCAYTTLFIVSNFNSLHDSLWITFLTQLRLVFYSFYVKSWLLSSFYMNARNHINMCKLFDYDIYIYREREIDTYINTYINIYTYIYPLIYAYTNIYIQISLHIIDILCLHIFFWIRSNSRITFIVFLLGSVGIMFL